MCAAAAGVGRGAPAIRSVIPEDSFAWRVASYIPIVGVFTSLVQQVYLLEKLSVATDAQRAIELVEEKNRYKVADIVRNALTALALVAAAGAFVAAGSLGMGVLMGVLGATNLGLGAYCAYQIHQNTQVIEEWRATGLRRDMEIR
jgi:hypothetical protein